MQANPIGLSPNHFQPSSEKSFPKLSTNANRAKKIFPQTFHYCQLSSEKPFSPFLHKMSWKKHPFPHFLLSHWLEREKKREKIDHRLFSPKNREARGPPSSQLAALPSSSSFFHNCGKILWEKRKMQEKRATCLLALVLALLPVLLLARHDTSTLATFFPFWRKNVGKTPPPSFVVFVRNTYVQRLLYHAKARLRRSDLLWNVSCRWVLQITFYFCPFRPIRPFLALRLLAGLYFPFRFKRGKRKVSNRQAGLREC